jgi:hypothetical protein
LHREQHSEAALRGYQVDHGCSRTEGAPYGVQVPPPHEPFSRFAITAWYRRFKLAVCRHDDEQRVGPVRQNSTLAKSVGNGHTLLPGE